MSTSKEIRPPGDRTYELEHVAIGTDVRVSAMTLSGDQCVQWHWHSQTSDIFFCLEGAALIQMKGAGPDVTIAVGERFDVEPGIEHRVSPVDGKRCRLVLIQGVGKADFHLGGSDRA
jgi:mannose-6-phosphate isomerase-like protein (cupin superfamily)